MDFNDSPEEAAFRSEVRAWLDSHASSKTQPASFSIAGGGGDVHRAKAWQMLKSNAGYGAITLPEEYGGGSGTIIQQLILHQEESRYDIPKGVYEIGLGMCVPTVLAFGSDVHRERYISRGIRGDDIWCQLFSEPSGGSDLASLRTKAEPQGNDWIVNGQKVWTSGAHFADYGIVLVRTDAEVPKHKGLTMFIVDMKAPGVEVRPIRQMSGGADFNEVFFNDVRIADSDRLGEIGGGWNVAMATLMLERQTAGQGMGFIGAEDVLRLAGTVTLNGKPASEDGNVRANVADWWINEQGLKLLSYRAQTALSKGQLPGPEQSVNKAVEVLQALQISYFMMDLMGGSGVEVGDDSSQNMVERTWAWAPGMRLGGGTDEILRNIIAERVLGLPGDVRMDKTLTFRALSASGG